MSKAPRSECSPNIWRPLGVRGPCYRGRRRLLRPAPLGHIAGGAVGKTFQPMKLNFGLVPTIAEVPHARERKLAMSHRAAADFDAWLGATELAA